MINTEIISLAVLITRVIVSGILVIAMANLRPPISATRTDVLSFIVLVLAIILIWV